jgi:hypothetical protein
MLKQSQAVGLKYFTPMSGSLEALRDDLDRYLKARTGSTGSATMPPLTVPPVVANPTAGVAPAAPSGTYASAPHDAILSEACYDLLMFQRRLRYALDALGGYYFKNLDAESLADALYQKHRTHLNFDLGLRTQFSAAGKEMRTGTTWAEFCGKLQNSSLSIQGFWLGFRAHMAAVSDLDLALELRILDAYAALLNYEVNRPLFYWYGERRAIRFKFTEKSNPSKDVFLKWKEPWQTKLDHSESQTNEYIRMGSRYLKDVEKAKFVETEKKHWWSKRRESA